jgi:succinate dehydrogenase / fumarate reductase, iron-sulfur subunit
MAIEDQVAPIGDETAPSGDEAAPAIEVVGPLPETVTMQVWRGDDEGGEFAEYQLPAQEGEVVLDVIHRIQATAAPDLACRWNCKAGKCGSCSAEINGRPALMCMTRMDTLPPGEMVTVAPMRTFPILRDLVTDVSFNYEVAKRVPSFTPRPRTADEEEAGGYRMQQIDIERSQEFRKCIECFLCQDVCHVMRDHEENKTSYAGPRFFIRSAELEMHPLDTNDRRELLQHNQGLGMCNITKCCTEVCPEHIKITDNAIIPLKERVVDATYDPIAWLGRKIRNRRAPRTPSEAAATAPSTGPAAVQPSPEVRGIPEPDTDRPQPYWESGLTETDAQTTTVVRDGLTAVPDGPTVVPDGPTVVPEGPMAVPGEPADGGDDAND